MRNVIATKLWTPFLAIALLSGCSKDDSGKKEDSTVIYKGYKIEVDPSALTLEQAQIMDKVNNEKPIEFADISEALIVEHARAYSLRNSQESQTSANAEIIRQQLAKNLANGLDLNADLGEIKMKYEDFFLLKQNQVLRFNSSANSPLDLILNSKLQSYSGTVFSQMVFRSGKRAQFVTKNPVVIYKKDHVLPGYMVETPQGFVLVEVETTRTNRGEHRTLVNDLFEEMHIIDAEVFALFEIFKSTMTPETAVKMRETAVAQTAERYGINLSKIRPGLNLANSNNVNKAQMFLNSDVLAFGDFNNLSIGDLELPSSNIFPIKYLNEKYDDPYQIRYDEASASRDILIYSKDHADRVRPMMISTKNNVLFMQLAAGSIEDLIKELKYGNIDAAKALVARYGQTIEIRFVDNCNLAESPKGFAGQCGQTTVIESEFTESSATTDTKAEIGEGTLDNGRTSRSIVVIQLSNYNPWESVLESLYPGH